MRSQETCDSSLLSVLNCDLGNLRAEGEAEELPVPSLCPSSPAFHHSKPSPCPAWPCPGLRGSTVSLHLERKSMVMPLPPPLGSLRSSGIIRLWQPVTTNHRIRPKWMTFLPIQLPGGHADSLALSPQSTVYNGLRPALVSSSPLPFPLWTMHHKCQHPLELIRNEESGVPTQTY